MARGPLLRAGLFGFDWLGRRLIDRNCMGPCLVKYKGGAKVNEVRREYNGLGQLVREWQSHIGAGGPAPMMPKDRSKFLATLDQAVQSVRKMFRKRP